MKIAAITDIGSCRQENQDNYCAQQLPGGTAWGIVCDGMGGHSFGEIASKIVCNTIADFWMKHICMQDSDSKVKLACKKASCAIDLLPLHLETSLNELVNRC